MSDCTDPFAAAVRIVTRRAGRAIWDDPGRLRSRLHFEVGPVSTAQSALLDALVIAALQGVPGSLLRHDDPQPVTVRLSDAVGPLRAAEVLSIWNRALAQLEREPDARVEPAPEPEREPDIPTEPEREPAAAAEAEPDPAPVAETELVPDRAAVTRRAHGDLRALTLVEKLRPPPPVPARL